MFTYGDLSIVAAYDAGAVTGGTTAPAVVRISPVKAVAPFLPIFVLAPFLFLRPNRRAQAWAVLIPFALIAAIAIAVRAVPGQAFTRIALPFIYASPFAGALALALAVLCLTGHMAPSRASAARRLAIPALLVLPATLVLWIDQSAGSAGGWVAAAGFAAGLLLLLAVVAVAGKRSRKGWGLGRFSAWFLLASLALSFLAIWITLGVLLATQPGAPPLVSLILVAVLFPPAVAAILFLLVFPFILTAFLAPLYRERMAAAFGVEEAQPPAQPVPQPVSLP
jgi:hypothetical protein